MVYSLTPMRVCTTAIGLFAPICLLAQIAPDSAKLPASAGYSQGIAPGGVANPPAFGASAPDDFANYQAYADAPVLPWRESNDRVRQVGGWKAYARQAQSDDVPGAASPTPAPTASPQEIKP